MVAHDPAQVLQTFFWANGYLSGKAFTKSEDGCANCGREL